MSIGQYLYISNFWWIKEGHRELWETGGIIETLKLGIDWRQQETLAKVKFNRKWVKTV